MGAVSADAFRTPGDVTDGQTVRTAQMSKAVVSAAWTPPPPGSGGCTPVCSAGVPACVRVFMLAHPALKSLPGVLGCTSRQAAFLGHATY